MDSGDELDERVRRAGAGRKGAAERDPGLEEALFELVSPVTRGDPEPVLVWTSASTVNLARALTEAGHPVSATTVGEILKGAGYSLQANAKTIEGRQHPDRDGQFCYINAQIEEHLAAGDPVVSVDTKKKENAGNFKNGGKEWRPAGDPVKVSDHDFPGEEPGKAISYGVYDVAANTGWVSVGTDRDTAQFAVQTIRTWWEKAGKAACPITGRLLICADAGGANGYRTRLWKTELAAFAAEAGISVTVCHLPPGTSKWNKIEHRLFSHISMNWRGRPRTSHEVIVSTIAATTTATGLTVQDSGPITPRELFRGAICGNATARVPRPPADPWRTAPSADPGRVRAALQRSSTSPVAGTKTSAARSRPSDRCVRPDQAQASHPRPDQRVPESSLAIAESTGSELVCEFWHGTGSGAKAGAQCHHSVG